MDTWTILGAGAIGGLLACQLSDASIPVNLALRPIQDTNRQPKETTIQLIRGELTRQMRFPVLAPDQPVSRLILTTKTWQSQEALSSIRHQLTEKPVLLVLQNGMGTTDWLAETFPEATLMAGTTTHGAYREPPDQLIHAGIGETWAGPLRASDRVGAETEMARWQQQGMAVEWDNNILKRLWLKLGINCAINPLTVIHDCRNGGLLEIPEALDMMRALCKEFTRVYEQRFDEPLVGDSMGTEALLSVAMQVAKQTANNISSMRQDALKGRPTEIDAINGYLVQQARENQIPCPANEMVLKQIRTLTAGN